MKGLAIQTPTCLGLLGWANTLQDSGDALKESSQVAGPEGYQ